MRREPGRARLVGVAVCAVVAGFGAWRVLVGTDDVAPVHDGVAPPVVEASPSGAPELPAPGEGAAPPAIESSAVVASVARRTRPSDARLRDASDASDADVLGRLLSTPTMLDLAGTVRTTAGTPVEGALLTVRTSPGVLDGGRVELGSAVTDAAGRYRVGDLAVAPLDLTCTWRDATSGRSGTLTQNLGFLDPRISRELDIVVPVTAVPIERAVRVTDERGLPCPDHVVAFVSELPQPGGRRARIEHGPGVTGVDGRCRVPVLQTGTMEVVVSGPADGDLWKWSVSPATTLAPARDHEITKVESRKVVVVDRTDADELDLGVPAHDVLLMGVLRDASGRPVDVMSRLTGYGPWLVDEDDEANTLLPTGDGYFEVLVPPGPGTVRLPLPSFVVGPEVSYDHRFHQDVGVVVVAPAAGLRITLQDTADDGTVVEPTVRLQITDDAGESRQSKLDPSEDGTFLHWTGLASGRYEITASAPGYVTARVSGDLLPVEKVQEVLVRMDQRP